MTRWSVLFDGGRRWALWIGIVVVVLILGLVTTLMIPISSWRTGRMPISPLNLVKGGPPATMSHRIWIDTDAACGAGARTDPDDCLAIGLLAGARQVSIATVFGNAALSTTDKTARALLDTIKHSGGPTITPYAGASEPLPATALRLGAGGKARDACGHAVDAPFDTPDPLAAIGDPHSQLDEIGRQPAAGPV
jgi:hypothetical protein